MHTMLKDSGFIASSDKSVSNKVSLILMLLICSLVFSLSSEAAPKDVGVNYDIVYVRYPAKDPDGGYVTTPHGEFPYNISPGADLVLLHPDGSEEILVNCDTCSVMDPFISFDARWVYYSKITDIDPNGSRIENAATPAFIYKIDLTASPSNRKEIQLTFDDGFESRQYKGNDTAEHDQGTYRHIRDMGPVPLADGRIVFTSNRAGLTAFREKDAGNHNAFVIPSVQQLYVVDDHDGSLTDAGLSNLHRLEVGTMHMAQHPIQMKDGRILFSTWQDVAARFNYAMTSLFTVHPDGSNLRQFTEPHDHKKNVEHFITQLSDGQVVSTLYYPGDGNYGYGIMNRYPTDIEGIEFLRHNHQDKFSHNGFPSSYREFDRVGTRLLTPHTDRADRPAPNLSGKYSMPSVSKNGDLLVAYSTGSVNTFKAKCEPDHCEHLKSGIYLIPNAVSNIVYDPTDSSQLVEVKNDPAHNEIWPRAVLTYQELYGQSRPDLLDSVATAVQDDRIRVGEAAGIVGTSSMYNRDPSDNEGVFQSSNKREKHDGNWTIQGAEAGVFTNSDIKAVRLISTAPKPFTKPISKYGDNSSWSDIVRYLNTDRNIDVVQRYGATNQERWEIIGEFPLTHKSVTDKQGNPDSSWAAKIPADTPFLIQALDGNGMTIFTELTWRGLKSGEARTDCGGCHAHSVEKLSFSSTQAGKRAPITGVTGLEDNPEVTADALWDLTTGKIPLLHGNGVELVEGYVKDIEFYRDVKPIVDQKCTACHTSSNANGIVLDGAGENDSWSTIMNRIDPNTGRNYEEPQYSKYIRSMQARQSLFIWVAYGERLDGRENSTRSDDVDYPAGHPAVNLTETEKRTLARWVDLGSPVDFQKEDGFSYTADNQLPVINVFNPKRGVSADGGNWVIGAADAKSGVDWSQLSVSYCEVSNGVTGSCKDIAVDPETISADGVLTVPVPSGLSTTTEYMMIVSLADKAGNVSIDKRRFIAANRPNPPQSIKITIQ